MRGFFLPEILQKSILPEYGISPRIDFNILVFPPPLGPIIAASSPHEKERSISERALLPEYSTERERMTVLHPPHDVAQ